MEFINHPKIQAIRSNTELLKDVWYTTRADINDIPRYLGPENVSAKYDPIKILGRWTFDVPSAIAAIRRAKPNISSREMQGLRQYMDAAFGKTSLAVRPDNKLLIKSIPGMALPASAAAAAAAGTPNPQTLQGEWRDATEGKYQVSVAGANLLAAVEGERLIIKTPGIQMVFNREY
jgi:hypothetical protein